MGTPPDSYTAEQDSVFSLRLLYPRGYTFHMETTESNASRNLRGLGFDAASLSGGIGAWQRAGGEIR